MSQQKHIRAPLIYCHELRLSQKPGCLNFYYCMYDWIIKANKKIEMFTLQPPEAGGSLQTTMINISAIVWQG